MSLTRTDIELFLSIWASHDISIPLMTPLSVVIAPNRRPPRTSVGGACEGAGPLHFVLIASPFEQLGGFIPTYLDGVGQVSPTRQAQDLSHRIGPSGTNQALLHSLGGIRDRVQRGTNLRNV